MQTLIDGIEASLADLRLSDDERRALSAALREASPPEEGLRRLRNRAFELVRDRLGDPAALGLLKWLEGVVRALDGARVSVGVQHEQVAFSPGSECLGLILQQVQHARDTLDVCVFTLSDDRIAEALLAAHRRGVRLRLLTDNDKEFDAGSDVDRLRRAGVPVAVDRSPAHMHHKFAVVDGRWLLNGSYNWTRGACEHNEENLVLSNRPALVQRFAERFERMWARWATTA